MDARDRTKLWWEPALMRAIETGEEFEGAMAEITQTLDHCRICQAVREYGLVVEEVNPFERDPARDGD